MQKRFSSTKQTILHRYRNELNIVNQVQLNYFTIIHLLILRLYKYFMCYNHKTKYTDWCPILNDGGWGICLSMWKPGKRSRFDQFEQRSHVYNAVYYNMFFPVDPGDRVIMESQCIPPQSKLFSGYIGITLSVWHVCSSVYPSVQMPCKHNSLTHELFQYKTWVCAWRWITPVWYNSSYT